MHRSIAFLTLAVLLATAPATLAAIGASGGGGPSTTTGYNGDRVNGFTIVEDVAYDASTGPWLKELINADAGPPPMIPSGFLVPIDETFSNVGALPWTDWHERVASRTTFFDNSEGPGFLFHEGSLSVYRNGGLLVEGSDYQLTTEVITGQVSANGDWEAFSILFGPGATIQPGDSLRITKDIFEVFGNSKQWAQGEAAVLAQYPTVPEPASTGIVLVGAACVAASRLRRRRRPS